MATKIDPIRKKYYEPLKAAEKTESILFYVSIILSFINIIDIPILLGLAQILFLSAVIALGTTMAIIRFYLAPRAQEHRYKDFLSYAFKKLNYEEAKGYYNNNEAEPARRMAAQILENSFYSKNIISKMLKYQRWKILIYFLIFIILLSYRNTELNIIIIVAQIIFSELIILRWVSMEWLHNKFENVFEGAFNLFQNEPETKILGFELLNIVGIYEIAKANSNTTLSEKIFLKENAKLDKEWEKIKKQLTIS